MKFVWQALADWKTYVQALISMWYAAPETIELSPLMSLSTARSLMAILLPSLHQL